MITCSHFLSLGLEGFNFWLNGRGQQLHQALLEIQCFRFVLGIHADSISAVTRVIIVFRMYLISCSILSNFLCNKTLCIAIHVIISHRLNSSSKPMLHATWWQQCQTNMANLRLQPPDPFNFHSPDEWTKWKRRYRSSSALPPVSRAPMKLARYPRCSIAWGRKQRTYLPPQGSPTKNGNGMTPS